MPINQLITIEAVLISIAGLVGYYDIRYRRIPNPFVLGVLVSGLTVSAMAGGWRGLAASLLGGVVGFLLMFILRLFGGLGAGDVKLFAAIGTLIGPRLALSAFVATVLVGGLLAVVSMVHSKTTSRTMRGVASLFAGQSPIGAGSSGLKTGTAQTIPYGVAISLGSVIAVARVIVGT